MGGSLYIQNLARAIASLPAEERNQIRLSVALRPSNSRVALLLQTQVDSVYTDGFLKLAWFEGCKVVAERIPRFIPLDVLNVRKYDFVYPELAGRRAPYAWGGWIPDFQYRHLPAFFSEKEIALFDAVCNKVADASPVVVLSSRMAQEDFQRFYPKAGSKSRVMNFVSMVEPALFQFDPKTVQEKYQLPDEFFLVSNQFWRHKDHELIIEALGILKSSGICPTVVCTGTCPEPGHSQHGYYRHLIERIETLGLQRQIRILGFIPRDDQIQLMRRCLAVIQPSLFEGWSTVVEDARATGKPILLSDFPVHLEQHPPDGRYFERGNREQLAALVKTAWSELRPGPDLEREKVSKERNREDGLRFARRFLEIVRETVGRQEN